MENCQKVRELGGEGREGVVVNADVFGDGTTVEVEIAAGTPIGPDGKERLARAVKLLLLVDEVEVLPEPPPAPAAPADPAPVLTIYVVTVLKGKSLRWALVAAPEGDEAEALRRGVCAANLTGSRGKAVVARRVETSWPAPRWSGREAQEKHQHLARQLFDATGFAYSSSRELFDVAERRGLRVL